MFTYTAFQNSEFALFSFGMTKQISRSLLTEVASVSTAQSMDLQQAWKILDLCPLTRSLSSGDVICLNTGEVECWFLIADFGFKRLKLVGETLEPVTSLDELKEMVKPLINQNADYLDKRDEIIAACKKLRQLYIEMDQESVARCLKQAETNASEYDWLACYVQLEWASQALKQRRRK